LKHRVVLASLLAALAAGGCAFPHAPQEFDFRDAITLCAVQPDGSESCVI
jgi:hypothetical protein